MTLYKNRAEIHAISQKKYKIKYMWRIPQLEINGFEEAELKDGVLELECCFLLHRRIFITNSAATLWRASSCIFPQQPPWTQEMPWASQTLRHWAWAPLQIPFPCPNSQTRLVSTCPVLSLWTDTAPKHKKYKRKFWRKRKHGKKPRWIKVHYKVNLNDLLSKNLYFSKIVCILNWF